MYKTEMDRLNKKIDEGKISLSAKRALYNLVEEFFSVNYQNISKKRKNEVENNFKLQRIINKLEYGPRDVNEVGKIVSQIENNLFTILDQSVDKRDTEDQNRVTLVFRGLLRGIPYLGHAIDALFRTELIGTSVKEIT
ncbi:MAG: hypothetical protein C5S48_07880 [Candidatus Methanogaster sp.]|nr:MAG: hypothetical protein C5S48_07880 [ANME-2 cluster archaeon]